MKIIFYILTLLFQLNIIAQIPPVFLPFPKDALTMTTVDSGNIRVWYALNPIDINDSKTYDDLQRLEIGKYISKYYSHFVYTSDSLCTEWGKKHPKTQSAPNRMGDAGKRSDSWSEYHYSEYFKDFLNDTFTEYARMPRNIPNYQYAETVPVQEWEIQDDTSTIAGYPCQKAITRFRGRDYIAWFALDIPINNGPWKFGGLPGLILKVYDKEKLYLFECIKIENNKKKYPIRKYNYKDFSKVKRQKVLQLQKELNEDYFKIAGWVMVNQSKEFIKIPYYPLELE
jgi:GLPGLI family protein